MAISTKALERRIKRYVHAPVHSYFAVTVPGLEPVTAAELHRLDVENITELGGGVAFSGHLEDGYRANLHLRSAGRVLMRLAEFRAGAIEDVYRKTQAVPWDTFLSQGSLPEVKLSLQGAYLDHPGLITRTIIDGVRGSLETLGWSSQDFGRESDEDHGQAVYVRMEGKRCTLSLDMTGERLHKRGYRVYPGRAPIRETTAAGIILSSGWEAGEPLLDLTCGSGTFAIEAAMLARNMPPGRNRTFGFSLWPAFKKRTWEYLKKQAEGQILEQAPGPIHASDIDPMALDAARQNAEAAGVLGNLTLDQYDFTQTAAPGVAAPTGLVVANPPYGNRLEERQTALALVKELGRCIKKHFHGWRFAIVLPKDQRFKERLNLTVERSLILPHGGLKVEVVFGKV
ncbi:MAG: class I SAM-dependent RNA methyltransferase [Deltaproteobacteria bacterium]|nr:class I SAM-dependent RNA methyltransferase [Deltaproteobacteria bacterium]